MMIGRRRKEQRLGSVKKTCPRAAALVRIGTVTLRVCNLEALPGTASNRSDVRRSTKRHVNSQRA